MSSEYTDPVGQETVQVDWVGPKRQCDGAERQKGHRETGFVTLISPKRCNFIEETQSSASALEPQNGNRRCVKMGA
jgi:hypothetical protein